MGVKHHGLSLLADTYHELTQEAHYPVKRRGEERRLNPNWTAIAWLEAESLDATEIVDRRLDPCSDGDIVAHIARGKVAAQIMRKVHVRPILQLFPADTHLGRLGWYRTECPACYDFSRSWNCPEHQRPAVTVRRRYPLIDVWP